MKKSHKWILGFNLAYIAIFGSLFVRSLNYEFIAYTGVVVLLGFIVIKTLNKSGLDNFALWALSIWGFLHLAGGTLRVGDGVLYGVRLIDIVDKGGGFYILKMDQVIHFYGFAVAAIVVFQLMQKGFMINKYPKTAIFLAWVGSMGLGALNEVIEFLAFIMIEKTGVGDLYNLGLDLIFNMAGAFVGSLIAFNRSKR